MTNGEDIDLIAAEYVLGTLPAGERAAVTLRAHSEPRLAGAIEAWGRRLAPLVEVIPPREAPATIWPEIEARVDALEEVLLTGEQVTAQIVGIKRRLSRWRAAAVTATALAASLLLFVGYREIVHPPERTLVAVLQKDAQSPAFLVSVDLDRRLLTIRAVAAEPQRGKSYELWLVNDELKTPRSLGIVGEQAVHRGGAAARGLFAEGHRGRDARRQSRARRRLAHRTTDRSGAVCGQAAAGDQVSFASAQK